MREEKAMPNRRGFLKNVAGATAGMLIGGRGLADAGFRFPQIGAPPGKRREVFIGGRRVKTVDIHARCFVPEVWDLVKDTNLAASARANLTGPIALGNPQRLQDMDARGVAIGGSCEGQELSDRKFDPFWAKAEELGIMIFMHPQTAPGTTQNARLQGKGGLGNTIGNPLETTVFLSHLIFEGTLDRFPGLKICGAHAGG